MKKIVLSLSIIILTAFAIQSCDKIEQNDDGTYTVYSGAVGEWINGNGVADKSQRALLEKYTGLRCNNCPKADTVIATATAQYNGLLIPVSIHDSSFSFCRPWTFSTPTGNEWSHYFGTFGQYPQAIVNRSLSGSSFDRFDPTSGITSHVDPLVQQSAKVAIAADAACANNTINVTVNLEFVETVAEPLTLTICIIEDNLVATQLQPDGHTWDSNYVHNHIFRDVVTDMWGADIDCSGTAGEKRMAVFSTNKINPDWKLENCHIVAFVSYKESRDILNVVECEIE